MGASFCTQEPGTPSHAVSSAVRVPGGRNGADFSASFEIELEDSWSALDGTTVALIVEAESRGQPTVEYRARGQQYVVDLRSMTQANKNTGKTRRIRRQAASDSNSVGPPRPDDGGERDEIMAITDIPPLRTVSTAEGPMPMRIPDAPGYVVELTQMGESELGHLKDSTSALDAFILQLPKAKSVKERAQTMRQENSLLVNAVAGKLATLAQRADAEGDQILEQALDTRGALDATALASFRERFIQQKMEKQRVLLVKRRLQCSNLEWHTLCAAPAAGSRS